MPFATAAKLTDMGFDAKQFGAQSDFTAYLDAVIAGIALEVEEEIGASAYAAIVADSVEHQHAIQAEVNLCAAELWSRRISYIDQAARTQGDEDEMANLHAQYKRNAETAEERARKHLVKLTSKSVAGGIAVGHEQTGALATV